MKYLFCTILYFLLCFQVFAQSNDAENYLNDYKEIAIREMQRSGVPASITLAQGMLESSNGKSRLATRGKNHFGIKCNNGWTGKRIRKTDDARRECFRKYKKSSDSFRDHSDFLRNSARYSDLFSLNKNDYKGWAYGLKKTGYATNPKYPELLIGLIERYQLSQFDNKTPSIVNSNSKNILYQVKKGDTLFSISKKLNVELEELKRLNNLKDNNIGIGDELKIP